MSSSETAAAAAAAKLDGNEALKSADLPKAIELYEKAVELVDKAIDEVPQEGALRNNQLVRYADGRYAIIDTAYPQFEDYVIMDLYSRDLVRHKVGKHDFDVVSKRFLRQELHSVPQDLFDLKVACLQNIALATLKMAKGTKRASDFEDAVKRANDALALDGKSAKALMRKGQALVDLRDWQNAFQCLAVASQETKGKDPEVQRLLQTVMVMKGKGKGNPGPRYGKGKGGLPFCPCKDPKCEDGTKCYEKAQAEALARANPPPPPPIEEESGSEVDSDEEILKKIKESEWKPVDVPPPPEPPKLVSGGQGLRTSIRGLASAEAEKTKRRGSGRSSSSDDGGEDEEDGKVKIEEINSDEEEKETKSNKNKKKDEDRSASSSEAGDEEEQERKQREKQEREAEEHARCVKEAKLLREEQERKRQERRQQEQAQQQAREKQEREEEQEREKKRKAQQQNEKEQAEQGEKEAKRIGRREADDDEDDIKEELMSEGRRRLAGSGKSWLCKENLPLIGLWVGAVSMAISIALFLTPVYLHYTKGGNEDIEL